MCQHKLKGQLKFGLELQCFSTYLRVSDVKNKMLQE
jgi:hypothetical protein